MNEIKTILEDMYLFKYIGGRHTPEKKFLRKIIIILDKKQRREFIKEYKQIINDGLIIREFKRTKKGMDWHISLNPRKIKEIQEVIK
ncbi:hypothetical protein HN695_00085 [Candidatus Woesearchaeota archaeon]|jgi:hypothetical protein|nr:hypothetical protein [Candidatus Woesearchaeota archaeon]MBT5272862.1 hypothetical protein [Candidatus Woesearchaeota archaeon]MBT6041328.1 hypothetical protein [Candidatus Woesearchaeota archaeon]MBT6336408.1 hypothetical protein [Candidatus Woesearchaeota archaeon]MBT7926711.1 hypothetical protein [Candidatus Woesearchaeota archaeon]